MAVGACTERELTDAVELCTADGRLNPGAVGWSRRPLHDCALPRGWGRRKRWDFWGVAGDGVAMNLVCADVDYAGIVGIWFHDFATGESIEKGALSPFGRGMTLPRNVAASDIAFSNKRLDLSFTEEPGGTRLRARFDGFDADVFAHRPGGHESLGVVIPWSDKRFQYTNKDVARPARGTVVWHGKTYELDSAWACLDFGRGKWPYRTTWNWGTGAGVCGGVTVGVQLGGKWTDGTGMTENALYVDGTLSKISEELVWTYDEWLAPWTIRTPQSDRVDLTFTPVHDKVTRLNLGALSQSVDQCFGTYSGSIVPDDGESIRIDGVFGWAEEATWRW